MRERERKEISCVYNMYEFELIMQKKTVRLYFIENIHDNDDLIGHVHHGRSQLKLNYVRLEQQTRWIPLVRKDNCLEQICTKEKREEIQGHECRTRLKIKLLLMMRFGRYDKGNKKKKKT
jgi:hypothetical protein